MRSSRLCAPLLAVVALAAFAQPAAALSAGGNGADVTCQQGPASVTTQFTTPTQISGGGSIQCPAPGNNSSGGFGATGPGPGTSFPPPTIGSPCRMVEQLPVQFRYPGVGPQYQREEPFNLIEPFATNKTTTYPWSGANFGMNDTPPGQGYISGDQWYYSAGFGAWYKTFTYDGTWQKEPDGTIGCHGTTGWVSRCQGGGLAVQCFDFVPQTVAAPGPAPLPPDLIDLGAFVRGKVFGGNVTAVPNGGPGVTNLATCYYLNGVTAGGQPVNPNQSTFWEQIVTGGPVDGEGHQVYFVFVIQVAYEKTVWDFGDGAVVPIQGGGTSLDPHCPQPQPNQPFAASHVYTQYSTGDGFHVTVTHYFSVSASEVWTDTNALTNTFNFPVLEVPVPGNPQPFFAKQIVQEEGVPIGG